MAREIEDLDAWYLDSYTSRHICNDKYFSLDLRLKSYEFLTAGGEIIRSEEVGSVYLPTNTIVTIIPKNITYMLICNSNLILLGQL